MNKKPGEKGAQFPWTQEQDDSLRWIWTSAERVKENTHLFGNHSYGAIIQRASYLGLGKRAIAVRQSSVLWECMKRELKERSWNRFDLADCLGAHPKTVYLLLVRACKSNLAYICKWDRRPETNRFVPIYALGNKPDVPKPPLPTHTEKSRLQRKRIRNIKIVACKPIRGVNPFAVAIGLVKPSSIGSGRVYRQSMSIREDEMEAV